MPLKSLLIFFLLLFIAVPLRAQSDPELPTVSGINYDDTVNDSLTNSAFFDQWRIDAAAGDIMVVDMVASGGLEPLIGIADPTGSVVIQSVDGEVDGRITLEYTVPQTGAYTIVATRVGNEKGSSTGTYFLQVRRANAPGETGVNQYQEVTFRCENYEVTTAANLWFQDDTRENMIFRMTVYGIGDFEPVIRVRFNVRNQEEPFELCNTDAELTVNDIFTLPGEEPRTITADNLTSVSQLLINGAEDAETIQLTIGSKDGKPGRYMAIIDGFTIDQADDIDGVELRLGPLAASSTFITAYMVATPNSRLDPYLTWLEQNQSCDDAGRGDCRAVPTFAGAGALLHEGAGMNLRGDRSDAGLILATGMPDPINLEMTSRSGQTFGGYALVLIGELPARNPSN